MEKVFTSCTNEGPITVTVKDGKVTRIQPLVMQESDFKPWTIKAGGKEYTPPLKANLAPFVHAERTRLYSPDRIKYPMKRVDFDPDGARNPEHRGKSGYERISWEEALDIVSGEIKHVKENYGGAAITGLTSSHHNWGIVGYKMGPFLRFMDMLEYTPVFDNPDSWEGWHWGATHAWGYFWRLGMPEQYDLLEDSLKNTEMIVFWSNDPDTTRAIYCGQDSVIWRQWLKEKGVKMVFLDPYYNYTAAHMDGTWFPLNPDSGAALALAIAFTWIEEDTYDKEFVKNRAVGFDEFKKYVLGKEDGRPKTPEWAAEESGIPARKIRSLAREWAAKNTVLAAGTRGGEGGACRTAFGTEWARLMVLLQSMQGLGKAGNSIWGTAMGAPADTSYYVPGYADLDTRMAITRAARTKIINPTQQRLYRLTLPDAILNPPYSWMGAGFCGQSLEQQFQKFTYPMEGYHEVKMFYRYGGSFMGTMSDTNKWVRMYQSPKLEFVVNQDCWYCSETNFADIILPACTSLERDDWGEWGAAGGYSNHGNNGCNFRIIVRQQKAVEPLWESKPDYEILTLLADRLGMKDLYTDGGRTDIDWAKAYYEISDLPKIMNWEEFDKKGYIVISPGDDYKPTPALRWYYEGRTCDTPDSMNPKRGKENGNELSTYSGKIEFVSQSLLKNTPDDIERPALPQYIESWEGHKSPIREKYPLMIISPHPRFTFHTQYDKHTDWLNEIPTHRIIKDDYAWWPVRINPKDAAKRGINNNDIVKLFNDRGSVLCIAVISERVPPGVVHSYGSAANYDPIEPGKAGSVDRGGCVNILTSSRMMSQNAPGMTPNSCLIEIEKWED